MICFGVCVPRDFDVGRGTGVVFAQWVGIGCGHHAVVGSISFSSRCSVLGKGEGDALLVEVFGFSTHCPSPQRAFGTEECHFGGSHPGVRVGGGHEAVGVDALQLVVGHACRQCADADAVVALLAAGGTVCFAVAFAHGEVLFAAGILIAVHIA